MLIYIQFAGVLVGSLTEKQASNLEVLVVACIFSVSLKKMNKNWVCVSGNGCIEPHLNNWIVIAVAFILISLEIKRADWGMMGGLFKTQTHPSDVALIGLSDDWIERFFDVRTNGSSVCDALCYVGYLFGDVFLL